jgi:hypothetical protein
MQFLSILLILMAAHAAFAEPTRIDVRVLSSGAKFIGTSMGGVEIVLRDADSGELYARGVTRGGTGDTDRIMKQAHPRGDALADANAAVYSATLDLDEPRRIEVVAFGPLAQRQSANRVSATQWVVPGKHLTGGDGWLLEMPGLVVDILDPPAHVGLSGLPREIEVRANVTKMCGCPLTPGGLWDADQHEVTGILRRNGVPVREFPLSYAGEPSQYGGRLTLDSPGSYEIIVYAYQPASGSTGLDRTTFNLAGD